ncbi:MAG: DUF2235 domain-containing protein [Pseudohongiellaceae bacterium]
MADRKLLIFNFDGTSNDPGDAVQTADRRGAIDDDSITNVLKFHFLAGGNLKLQTPGKKKKLPPNRQLCFYYSGIGTYGNVFQRMYNAGLSSTRLDVRTILNNALADFTANYTDGDRILLTGFSRGAALARRFAAIINAKVSGKDIIEAVFDTVASIGLPNLSRSMRPETEVVFEHGCTLPSNVLKALHMVSLDDKRKAFQPTLMNSDKKVEEIWFTGAHSDVGGGYYFDGLADVVFRYMINWIESLDWSVELLSPSQIDYENLVGKNAGYEITTDDLSIDPDYFGDNHEQSRTAAVEWLTLMDRRLCVLKNDALDPEARPKVFHSVARRIACDRNYLPRSLKGIRHLVVYDSGASEEAEGYTRHKESNLQYLRRLTVGESVEAHAFAHKKFNHSGVLVEAGGKYKFEVKKKGGRDQEWRDAGIVCTALGWNRKSVKKGWKEIAIQGMEPFRRYPQADWFHLIGSVGDDEHGHFPVGKGCTQEITSTGELCLFANDLDRFYGNNFGKLIVTISRIA